MLLNVNLFSQMCYNFETLAFLFISVYCKILYTFHISVEGKQLNKYYYLLFWLTQLGVI